MYLTSSQHPLISKTVISFITDDNMIQYTDIQVEASLFDLFGDLFVCLAGIQVALKDGWLWHNTMEVAFFQGFTKG